MRDIQGMSKQNLINNFSELKKSRNNFNCLIHEDVVHPRA